MDQFFGCFKCRKKRKRRVSAPGAQVLPANSFGASIFHKNRDEPVSSTAPLKAKVAQKQGTSPKDLYKVRQIPTISSVSTSYGNGETLESSPPYLRLRASSNNATNHEVEKKSSPASKNEAEEKTVPEAFKATDSPHRKRVSDPLSQVEQIEEDLEKLRRKLTHEADEAKKLRDEVRYLRTCGESLESPSSFQTGSAGEDEGNQLNWPLLSVFAKIEPDGNLIEACSSRPLSPFRYLSEGCSRSFPQISKIAKEESTGSNCSTNGVNTPTRRAEEQNPVSAHQSSSSTEKETPSWERLGIFEASEDLLLEPIDGSSLVTDSEIVTSWENSFGQKDSEAQLFRAETEQEASLEDTAQSREVLEGAASEEQDRLSVKFVSASQKSLKEATSFRHCSGTTDILTQDEDFYTASESTEFLSFSSDGTVLVEDEGGSNFPSNQLDRRLMRCFFVRSSSGELSSSISSAARVVEETDISSGEIEEPSKSLFAFSPDTSSQGQSLSFASTSDGQAASVSDIFSNTDSEAESQQENFSSCACNYQGMKERSHETASQGCLSPQCRQSRRTWRRKGKAVSDTEFSFSSSVEDSVKDFRTQDLQPAHTSSTWDRPEVVVKSEGNSDHCSNASIHLSTECSGKRNANSVDIEGIAVSRRNHRSHASSPSVNLQSPAEDKLVEGIHRHATRIRDSESENLQSPAEDKLVEGTLGHAIRIRDSESENDHANSASTSTSEESTSNSRKATNSTVSGSESVDFSLSEWLKPSFNLQAPPSCDKLLAPAGTSHEVTSMQEQDQSVTMQVSSPLVQSPLEQMYSKRSTQSSNSTSKQEQTSSAPTASCSQVETLTNWMCSPGSPETTDKTSSEPDQTQSRTTSLSSAQAQTPPKWKQNQGSPGSSDEGTFKKDQTLSASLSTPSPQVQTSSNWMHDQWSPAKLADDRPILGTVAAHWSPVSTRKWWDGKGIPNSTNKYKEDQKVNWHATPFEVRLEQALAKQGPVVQKKLFGGAVSAEMEVAAGLSLQE